MECDLRASCMYNTVCGTVAQCSSVHTSLFVGIKDDVYCLSVASEFHGVILFLALIFDRATVNRMLLECINNGSFDVA